MSDKEAVATDLKGGHPPAVKVGGMRVVQHKKEQEKAEPPMTAEEQAEFGTSPPKTDKHHSSAVVSGAHTKGDKDFPAQAVKAYHEKPHPTHEKHRGGSQVPQNIHQPR